MPGTLKQLPPQPTRKQRLPWMESRLRRLRCVKEPSDRQRQRMKELHERITKLEQAERKAA